MEPSGGGTPEVRLYRRPSHGGALVEVATMGLAAPPRLLEVGPDPPVEEVDGALGRSAQLYLALVQDGRVVDIARLLEYPGLAAGAEEEDEDYWETGSNTSEGDWSDPPSGGHRVFEYDFTSSSSDEDRVGGPSDALVSRDGRSNDEQNSSDKKDISGKEDGTGDVEEKEYDNDDDDLEDDDSEDDDSEDDDVEDAQQEQTVKLMLRLWPAKKHTRIKLFSGDKWIATKAYCLSWIKPKDLEELFESSFKMDVAANAVFWNQDCLMDFEVHLLHSPNFDELVFDFKPSVLDFKFCQKLGGEGDCRVFKCLSQGRKYALKTVCLKEFCTSEPREVNIISGLKDKRVMAFYKAWIEPWIYKKRGKEDYLFILLELCESTLKHKLLPENFESIPDRWYLFEEMAKGVKAIHNEFIVHRDLKPDNIFFGADMAIRIGDFGDACTGRDEFGGYGGTPSLGTSHYSAPELKTAEKITEKADIYTVGVIFIELFTSFSTVCGKASVFGKLRQKGLPDDWVGYLVGDREGIRGFIESMLSVEPARRPSAEEILDYIHQ